jgi:putative membrane protein
LPVTRRPDPALLTYYALSSVLLGPFFFFALIPYYFRYRSIRYVVEDEGVTMRWGVLFRKEISLTYSRIQDIHLSSNVVERWLGLAKIQVQTASGSASAEMTIEGLKEFEAVRDFLYDRMRGARDRSRPEDSTSRVAVEGEMAELTAAISQIASEVRALRLALPTATSVERNDV